MPPMCASGDQRPLGLSSCNANVYGTNVCNVMVVQRE